MGKTDAKGEDLFCHFSALVEGEGSVRSGDRVTFKKEFNKAKNKWLALNVRKDNSNRGSDRDKKRNRTRSRDRDRRRDRGRTREKDEEKEKTKAKEKEKERAKKRSKEKDAKSHKAKD